MRSIVASVILLTALSYTALSETKLPQVRGPISERDVREIVRIVHAATTKPILFIDSVNDANSPDHTRPDRVAVTVEPSTMMRSNYYIVEKKAGHWQITEDHVQK
jgi:hypothetical protein